MIIGSTAKYSFGDDAWPGGQIAFDTNPDSAVVYINGKKVGYTPITETPIDSGFNNITIKKRNYYTYTRRIYTKAYKHEQHAGFVKLQMVSKYPKNTKSALEVKFGYLDSVPLLKFHDTSGFPKGLEGCETVIINALVDKQGKVVKTTPFRPSGNHVADSFSLAVIKRSQFTPAMTSFHEPIKYWVKVPINF